MSYVFGGASFGGPRRPTRLRVFWPAIFGFATMFLATQGLPDVAMLDGIVLAGVAGAAAAAGFLAVARLADVALRRLLIARARRHWRRTGAASLALDRDLTVLYASGAGLNFGVAPGAALSSAFRALLADPEDTLTALALRANKVGSVAHRIQREGRDVRVTLTPAAGGYLAQLDDTGVVADRDQIAVPLEFGADGTLVPPAPAVRRRLRATPLGLVGSASPGDLAAGSVLRLKTDAGDLPVVVTDVQRDGTGCRLSVLPLLDEVPLQIDPGEAARTLSALPVPIVKIAPDGTISQANGPAVGLLDLDMSASPSFFDIVDGPGRPVRDWVSEAFAGHGLQRAEVVRAMCPGRDLFLQVAFGRIDDGESAALLAILTDATELKTLEAQFVQSQKMQAIGQLAGGVAHDFNNLLTAISGHADLLLLRHDVGDPDYGDLRQIVQNANRAAALVGQLLAFSRKQTRMPELLDMQETMSELGHLLNRLVGERVQLDLDCGAGIAPVRADKRQLEQVMMNLVVNARDAMPGGGRIRVVTRMRTLAVPERRDRVEVPAGDYVEVRVIDEGIGIPPDVLPKIFEPFYTSKKIGEGTGLGLSTAYGIIKQTGGFIFAESAPGEGSTFQLLFPAQTHAEPVAPDQPEQPRKIHSGRSEGVVLLVEDEAPVRAFASRALRMKGLEVLEAESAEAALELLKDEALEIDVFVTDVIMPGMDGPTWVREALEARPDTRVIFVSGYAEEGLLDNRARVPNSVFLPKPFSLKDLMSTVQEQLA